VENSSGNTASSVAMIAAIKGYSAVIVVPSSCSVEKQNSVRAFGAHLLVAPSSAQHGSPEHYESVAKRLAKEIPGAVRLDQYNNMLNVEAHYLTTGPEIWQQTEGKLDYFVAGASTGGTISGVGSFLKETSNNAVQVVLADPNGSCYFNRVKNGISQVNGKNSQVEGVGKSYTCECMRFEYVDDAILVEDIDAFTTARRMASEEGILCGGSSGANVWAALQLANRATKPTNIVTVLPDGGFKYLSKVFNSSWLSSHDLISEEDQTQLEHLHDSIDDLINSFKTKIP